MSTAAAGVAAGRSRLLTHSAAILALQVLLQARALVQVPFLTHTLSPDVFGSLTLALSIAGSAGALSVLGLQTGLYLHLVRLEGPRRRGAIASVLGIAIPLLIALSALVAGALGSGVASRWLPGVANLALPLGLLIAGTALREVAMVVPRARQDVGFFAGNSLWMQYGGLALGVALVLAGWGAYGFLLGLGIGTLSGAIAAVAYGLRRSEGPLVWDQAFVGTVVRAAGPVVPLALAHMSLLSLDYAFVSRFLGPTAVATYGLAYTFASPVLLALAVIQFTLLPEYLERHRRGEAALAAFLEKILAIGWAGGLLLVVGAALVGPMAIEAIAGPAYREAGALLPMIVAAYVFFTLAQVLHLVRGALVASVTASAVVAGACAIMNAIANVWVVPMYGVHGAAVATLVSFVLYYLGMTVIVRPLVSVAGMSFRPPALAALAVAPTLLMLEAAPTIWAVTLLSLAVLAVVVFRYRTAPGAEVARSRISSS